MPGESLGSMRQTRAHATQHADHPLGCRSQGNGVGGRLLGREGVGTTCLRRWHRGHPDVCPRLWVLKGRDRTLLRVTWAAHLGCPKVGGGCTGMMCALLSQANPQGEEESGGG